MATKKKDHEMTFIFSKEWKLFIERGKAILLEMRKTIHVIIVKIQIKIYEKFNNVEAKSVISRRLKETFAFIAHRTLCN